MYSTNLFSDCNGFTSRVQSHLILFTKTDCTQKAKGNCKFRNHATGAEKKCFFFLSLHPSNGYILLYMNGFYLTSQLFIK